MQDMGDLLGMILPLIMQGSGMGNIFRTMTGANHGASFDGLQDVLQRQAQRASMMYPGRPTEQMIAAGANRAVEFMGVNPMSGFGQGLSQMFAKGYGIAPDILGPLMGVPDPGSFYRQISNGATGISMASGRGMPSIFNSYSTMGAYQNANNLAQMAYSVATNGGNGFDVSYSHGLSFGEMGRMTQRLLSNRDLYSKGKDAAGNDLGTFNFDDEKDVVEFKEKLKKYGSKLNEAASMITKVTGSFDESMALLDKLSGGNFLGGSVDKAAEAAEKAKNMAATIRVTSAMAGMDPREAYANLLGTQSAMVGRYGVNPILAQHSGLADMMLGSANMANMSYQMWAANNPNATPQEKMRMLAGAQGRVTAYKGSSAEALAAIVSGYKDMFAPEQLNQLEEMYRSGNTEGALRMVRDVLGVDAVTDLMNDKSAIQTLMLTGDKDFLNRMEKAGVSGNLKQATMEGAKRELRHSISRADTELTRATGKSGGRTMRRTTAVKEALMSRAEKYVGRDVTSKMSVAELKRLLTDAGEDPEEIKNAEHTAEIDSEMEDIRANTMSGPEEEAARERLQKLISGSNSLSAEYKRKLTEELKKGGDVYAMANRVGKMLKMSDKDIRAIYGGRLSRQTAQKMLNDLGGHRQTWSGKATEEERAAAIKAERNRMVVQGQGALMGAVASDKFKEAGTDKEAMENLVEVIREQEGKNQAFSGDKDLENVAESGTFSSAAQMMVKGLMDGSIGDLKATTKDAEGKEIENGEFNRLVGDIAGEITKSLGNDGTIEEGFKAGIDRILKDRTLVEQIGEGGKKQLEEWLKDPSKYSSMINRRALGAEAIKVVNSKTAQTLKNDPSKIEVSPEKVAELAKKNGRLDKRHAGFGGRGEQALSNVVMTDYALAGGDFNISENVLSKDQVDAVTAADDDAANRVQNRISRAVSLGSGAAERETIAKNREMMEDLSKVLRREKISEEDLKKAAAGDEVASKKLDEALKGRKEAAYEKSFITNFAKGQFGGGRTSGAEILMGDEKGRKAVSDKELGGTIMETERGRSHEYEIMVILGDILKFLTKLVSNPIATVVRNGV